MKLYESGLAIMRMQPLHKGHEKVIRAMMGECGRPVLVIGSAQESRTPLNPFTKEERRRMVYNVFGKAVEAGSLVVVAMDDLGDYPRWANHVMTELGFRPERYYCGSEKDGELFFEKGVKLRLVNREKLPVSGTSIREAIVRGGNEWRQGVNACNIPLIESYIQSFNGLLFKR